MLDANELKGRGQISAMEPYVGFFYLLSVRLFEKWEKMLWELLREHKWLPFPILELDKGVHSVLHAGGPADAGVSWLAQIIWLSA